jgi:hypothetical protein
MKEILANLKCLRCGHCCPATCKEKSRDEEGKAVCGSHPETTGKPRTTWGCDFPPEKYFRAGLACEAVLQALRKKYPHLSYQTETLPNGQVKIVEIHLF